MFTKPQEELLNRFADLSDKLFELGIITTDSFTGEIGEYIACKHFKLKKSERVKRAVDGVCQLGHNYQIKAKIVYNNNYNYKIDKLDTSSFRYLVIVYCDLNYCPIKIARIPANKIKDNKILVTSTLLNSGIEVFEKHEINIPAKEKYAISEFAKAYNNLGESGIIRSRRIVGDIGEFYACHQLDLDISSNKTEKGIDARHKNGLTFEIKTRRVYESGRRFSETRRLNNLEGKSADYLVVVALDRAFHCAGMWVIPFKNIENPKSAHLEIVNNTLGALNVVPSTISWLKTGEKFTGFDLKKTIKKLKPSSITSPVKRKLVARNNPAKQSNLKQPVSQTISPPVLQPHNNQDFLSSTSCLKWMIIIIT
jgi:hypothetical protein